MTSNANRIIVVILIISITVETGFFIQHYRNYQQMRSSLLVSEEEKRRLQAELDETKTKLALQEELYEQLLREKESLALELNALKADLRSSKMLLSRTKEEKFVLSDAIKKNKDDLVSTVEKLRLLEGKINSLDEVRSTLDVRLQSVREMRRRIREFRREAFLKKVEAQKELDRIKLQMGNRGLVVKNGKSTLSSQGAVDLQEIIIKKTEKIAQ